MAGVYSAAAELSLRNYVVAVTSRNAPGVDIVAVSPDLRKALSFQVKANKPKGTHAFWLLNKRAMHDVSKSLFYVFVNLKEEGYRPDFYVVPSRVVARDMVIERSKTKKQSTWYSFRRDENWKDRWEILAAK
jgi:hypothetical protein